MELFIPDTDPPESLSNGQTCRQAHCSVCDDLLPRPRYSSPGECWSFKTLSYEKLLLSKQNGCVTCSLVLCVIKIYNPGKIPRYIDVSLGAKDASLQEFFPLKVTVSFPQTRKKQQREKEINCVGNNDEVESEMTIRDEQSEDETNENDEQPKAWERFELQIYEEQDLPVGLPIGQARSVSRYSRSSACMSLLSSWLSECRDNHEACSHPPDVTLPTRVISVGSETELPRLYVPNEGTRGQYAALSHCWGGDVPLQTMTTNLEEHQRGIPEDELPRTFLDAVCIARKLQIPYLWIDSLCIVQDVHEDWVREAGRMGTYYSGATLTIAADRAVNSSEGCFNERPRKAWNSVRIAKHQFGLMNDVHVRMAPKDLDGTLGHSFVLRTRSDGRFAPVYESYLNKRAWALQEWALSRRIVHFTEEELIWECEQETTCECSVGKKVMAPISNFLARPLRGFTEDLLALYDQWMSIIYDFSKRSITYETDRLPAISGIAEAFSKKTKDEYVCGIWKNCPSTLVWKPCIVGLTPYTWGFPLGLRQDRFYAPSWSWASIATPIWRTVLSSNGRGELRNLAEILNVDSIPETTNRFGPVKKHAKLTIRGHVFPGRFDKLEPIRGIGEYSRNHFLIGKQLSTSSIRLDFPPVPPENLLPRFIILPEDRCRFEPDLHPGDEFVVLVVYQMPIRRRYGRESAFTEGLVLKAVDESDSIYRRVGTYSGEWWVPGFPEWDHSEEKTVTLV